MKQNKKWEDEFDEKFCTLRHDGYMELWNHHAPDIKGFISNILSQREKEIREEMFNDFLGTLDDDSCECDNCCRTRRYFENPKKEVLRYKNKLNAELKKQREEIVEEIEKLECVATCDSEAGYNSALEDIINLIQNK